VDLVEVLRIAWVGESANECGNVASANLVLRQGVTALAIDNHRSVLVLIDELHRHEPLAGVGQSNRDSACIEVENGAGVEGVAIHADDLLLIDWRRRAVVHELAEGTILHEVAKVEIGFGAGEVLRCDGDTVSTFGRLRTRRRCRRLFSGRGGRGSFFLAAGEHDHKECDHQSSRRHRLLFRADLRAGFHIFADGRCFLPASVSSFDERRRPLAFGDLSLRPVSTDVQREIILWRRQPVGLLLCTG
jgi:hypothetical protein